MVEIKTLQNTGTEELVDAFNLSFSDYMVPLQLTPEQLRKKMKIENTDLDYSVGAFDDGKLTGFVLHAVRVAKDKKVVYNGGTGVIPSHRGNGLTRKLYDHILPVFKENNVDHVILEVIDSNTKAIRTYEKIGFKEHRRLKCFKGKIKIIETDHYIKPIDNFDAHLLSSFWDFLPAWQNKGENLISSCLTIGAFIEQRLVGYALYDPEAKRLHQLAVDKNFRNRAIATGLFNYLAVHYSENISIINVDSDSTATVSFLLKAGLENFIDQIEMKLKV